MNDCAAAVVDKGCYMTVKAVWLVCILDGGVWVPRLDKEPAMDGPIAEAVAADLTRMSERVHRAIRFDSSEPPVNPRKSR